MEWPPPPAALTLDTTPTSNTSTPPRRASPSRRICRLFLAEPGDERHLLLDTLQVLDEHREAAPVIDLRDCRFEQFIQSVVLRSQRARRVPQTSCSGWRECRGRQ